MAFKRRTTDGEEDDEERGKQAGTLKDGKLFSYSNTALEIFCSDKNLWANVKRTFSTVAGVLQDFLFRGR
jgi:hypothetical protein